MSKENKAQKQREYIINRFKCRNLYVESCDGVCKECEMELVEELNVFAKYIIQNAIKKITENVSGISDTKYIFTSDDIDEAHRKGFDDAMKKLDEVQQAMVRTSDDMTVIGKQALEKMIEDAKKSAVYQFKKELVRCRDCDFYESGTFTKRIDDDQVDIKDVGYCFIDRHLQDKNFFCECGQNEKRGLDNRNHFK